MGHVFASLVLKCGVILLQLMLLTLMQVLTETQKLFKMLFIQHLISQSWAPMFLLCNLLSQIKATLIWPPLHSARLDGKAQIPYKALL